MSWAPTLYVDVETVGQLMLADELHAMRQKRWPKRPPEDWLRVLQREASLTSMHSEIVCIAVAIDDDPVLASCGSTVECLGALQGFIREQLDGASFQLVSHNASFDCRQLRHHAMRWRMPYLVKALPGRHRYCRRVTCTRQLWEGLRGPYPKPKQESYSLSSIARFLQLEGAEDGKTTHGRDVGEWVAAGDWASVERHCVLDVELLRRLHRVLLGQPEEGNNAAQDQ